MCGKWGLMGTITRKSAKPQGSQSASCLPSLIAAEPGGGSRALLWASGCTGGSTSILQAQSPNTSHIPPRVGALRLRQLSYEGMSTSLGNRRHSPGPRQHSPTKIPEVPVKLVRENKMCTISPFTGKQRKDLYLSTCWIVKNKAVHKKSSSVTLNVQRNNLSNTMNKSR